MKKDIVNFLCKLEGYKTTIKNAHFSASRMSEHKLMDDIADKLLKLYAEREASKGIKFDKEIYLRNSVKMVKYIERKSYILR